MQWTRLGPGTNALNMMVQEAQSLALYEAAGSIATASGAAGSGATGSELQATALLPIVLPPTLAQAHPEDQKELAKIVGQCH